MQAQEPNPVHLIPTILADLQPGDSLYSPWGSFAGVVAGVEIIGSLAIIELENKTCMAPAPSGRECKRSLRSGESPREEMKS